MLSKFEQTEGVVPENQQSIEICVSTEKRILRLRYFTVCKLLVGVIW